MATQPTFAATALEGSATVSATADTSYTSPSNSVSVVASQTNGCKIDEIRFQGTGTTVSGTITVFIFDGSAYHLIDVIGVPAVTASTTSPPWLLAKAYANLVIPNGSSLKVASTVASQLANVTALGGAF
jgi:hypothetical protein